MKVEKVARSNSEGAYGNYPDIYRIQITGGFEKNDDRKFDDAVAKLLPVFGVVVLNSPGGELNSALAIADEIKLRGYSTVVKAGDTCASACALVWLAGDTRYMEPSSKIGFHAASVMKGQDAVESGEANALVGAYLGRLGLTTDAIRYWYGHFPMAMMSVPKATAIQSLKSIRAMAIGPEHCNTQVTTLVAGKLCVHIFSTTTYHDFIGYEEPPMTQIWPVGAFDIDTGSIPPITAEEVPWLHESIGRDRDQPEFLD